MAPVEARVTVVVPNWNGRHLLDIVLGSVAEQSFEDMGVIVVDNGSSDGSLEHLARRWPEVEVAALGRNAGFAAAANHGVRTSAGELVALLNNDIRLEPGWIESLVRALERFPAAGSATGKLISASDPRILDGTGDVIGWDGYCARRGRGERDHGQYDRSQRVFSPTAAASMYRRAALEDVGPFAERFFAYIEDADWGFRAQLVGWECVYEPAAVAGHVGGATTGAIDGFELYRCHRNMVSLMVRNFPARALARHLHRSLLRRLGSLAKATLSGQGRVVWRAWRDALRDLPAALRERRAIQRRRVRDYRDLAALVPRRG